MKEEWLLRGAVVPVDVGTTAALVAEIHRLIDVVGGMALAQPDAFEQGRQKGMKQERALWELSRRGQEIEADPPKIGCVQHDCDECKARLALPVQEPVAWMNPYGGVLLRLFTGLEKNSYTIPLYTTPPQRPWVGLTHEEHMELMTGTMTTSSRMAAVEAKLKDKNT